MLEFLLCLRFRKAYELFTLLFLEFLPRDRLRRERSSSGHSEESAGSPKELELSKHRPQKHEPLPLSQRGSSHFKKAFLSTENIFESSSYKEKNVSVGHLKVQEKYTRSDPSLARKNKDEQKEGTTSSSAPNIIHETDTSQSASEEVADVPHGSPSITPPKGNVVVVTAKTTDELWHLSEAQKKQIKDSWTSVLTKEKQNPNPANRGSSLFFDTFYDILFRTHPNLKQMFEDKGMQAQARALMQMMNVLVKSIDDTTKLVSVLKKLGGHHVIYGVDVPHYQVFGVVLVETFETVLGKEAVTKEMKEAWFAVVAKASSLMIEGSQEAQKGISGWLAKYSPPKVMRKTNWKRFFGVLDCKSFSLYKDHKRSELKQTFELSTLLEVDIEDGNLIDLTTPHSFVLRGTKDDIYFCVDSSQELQMWISEFQWRIQATQRTIKYHRVQLEKESGRINKSNASHSNTSQK
jgi:hemoglobin-like flavoprotein